MIYHKKPREFLRWLFIERHHPKGWLHDATAWLDWTKFYLCRHTWELCIYAVVEEIAIGYSKKHLSNFLLFDHRFDVVIMSPYSPLDFSKFPNQHTSSLDFDGNRTMWGSWLEEFLPLPYSGIVLWSGEVPNYMEFILSDLNVRLMSVTKYICTFPL